MIETKLQPSVLPHAIIYWCLDGEIYFRTVCYDERELELALARHADPNDFYSNYSPSVDYIEKGRWAS